MLGLQVALAEKHRLDTETKLMVQTPSMRLSNAAKALSTVNRLLDSIKLDLTDDMSSVMYEQSDGISQL